MSNTDWLDEERRKREVMTYTRNNMRARCYSTKHNNYKYYGGLGVTVCDRWLDKKNGLDNFIEDMGYRPEGMTLDRIDPKGNYEPSNCRWTDRATQTHNQKLRNKFGMRGVLKGPNDLKFRAYIRKNYKSYNLGTFDTAEEAHAAYLVKEKELYG